MVFDKKLNENSTFFDKTFFVFLPLKNFLFLQIDYKGVYIKGIDGQIEPFNTIKNLVNKFASGKKRQNLSISNF